MKSILSKMLVASVVAACFTFTVQANPSIHAVADTAKMSKMKMDKKMDKNKMKKMDKMSKKDTASKM